MNDELTSLGLQLANTAVRNTAQAIFDRIGASRSRKNQAETISELEEIINALIDDKAELVRIAQAFESEMVAQKISSSDITYIGENLVPKLKELLEATSEDDNSVAINKTLGLLEPLISVETVTILQLLGFNLRKAVGEPLTELVSSLLLSRVQAGTAASLEIQRLLVERQVETLKVARDIKATARLREIESSL